MERVAVDGILPRSNENGAIGETKAVRLVVPGVRLRYLSKNGTTYRTGRVSQDNHGQGAGSPWSPFVNRGIPVLGECDPPTFTATRIIVLGCYVFVRRAPVTEIHPVGEGADGAFASGTLVHTRMASRIITSTHTYGWVPPVAP